MENKNLVKFGICEPYLQDIKLLPLYKQYIQSESYKNIQREYNIYKREKWDYMRTFYEPDIICKFIEDATCNFLDSWHKEQRKIYNEKNKDKITEQRRIYYEKNIEKLKEQSRDYGKKYRETHKEQVNQKSKRYQQKHKEERNAKLREKITCECGAIITKGYASEHRKTDRHFFDIKNQQ